MIIKKLKERRVKDILIGSCGIGPHRDNFLFENSDNIHFINYASQGQKRTAAISLKLSECDIIKNTLGKNAVILIDDIFSELDEKRRKNMVKLLSRENQVIFTMVNMNIIDDNIINGSKLYRINDNRIHSL